MDVGDQIIFQAQFRNRAGDPIDPSSIQGWVLRPDGVQDTLNFVSSEVGTWEASYTLAQDGDNFYVRVEASGTVTAAAEKRFRVKPQKVIPV